MGNPNVDVTGPSTTDAGAVEIRGGEGAMTFDELDSLTTESKGKKAAPKEKTEVKEAKDEKSKDLTSDDKKGSKELKSDKGTKAVKSEKEQEANTPPRKTIKAKYNDSETDLDEDALFTIKVNGKDEPVTLKDLMGNYSGKTAWDKKFSEVDKTRKDISAKQLKVSEIESKIQGIFNEKDPQMRVFKMAELAGISPVQFRQQFLDENVKMLEKWYGMSEDERKADALAYENAYLKHQQETQNSQSKAKQAQEELRARVEKLRAPHNISEEQFVARYEEINQLVNQGKIAKEQMTPEFIAETIVKDNLWSKAAEKVQELNLSWNEQQRGEKILDLVEKAYKIGIKPNDIPDIVDELWGQKKTQAKAQQKQAQAEEFKSGKKPVPKTSESKPEAIFFEDI
jgi:hypothetical protein